MGGLISRDVLLNAASYGLDLTAQIPQGLITLGTPNWGYPFLPDDEQMMCPQLVDDMAGSWNPTTTAPLGPSLFLQGLEHGWTTTSYGNYWLAAAGQFCANQTRRTDIYRGLDYYAQNQSPPWQPTGCLESQGTNSNDGVVCADSALYSYNSTSAPAGIPTQVFTDPEGKYTHTTAAWGIGIDLIMGCLANPAVYIPLNDPTPTGLLFPKIVCTINGNCN
jgi:hypothetical protein